MDAPQFPLAGEERTSLAESEAVLASDAASGSSATDDDDEDVAAAPRAHGSNVGGGDGHGGSATAAGRRRNSGASGTKRGGWGQEESNVLDRVADRTASSIIRSAVAESSVELSGDDIDSEYAHSFLIVFVSTHRVGSHS